MSLTSNVRNGVVGAIEEAFERYGDGIFAYCHAHAKPAAEDIHQQVFLHLTLHGDEVTGDIRSWLFSVAKDAIAEWKRVRAELPTRKPGRRNVFSIIDTCDDVEQLLGRLTPAGSAATRAIYLEGLTYEEAAKKLGVTEATLQRRLVSAKRRLCA